MIVRSEEAERKIADYIRMNPWKCVQNFGNGLRGIGNPALWNGRKLGVLCSRNAPHIGRIPKADVYFQHRLLNMRLFVVTEFWFFIGVHSR